MNRQVACGPQAINRSVKSSQNRCVTVTHTASRNGAIVIASRHTHYTNDGVLVATGVSTVYCKFTTTCLRRFECHESRHRN